MPRLKVYESDIINLAEIIEAEFRVRTRPSRQMINPWIAVYDITDREAEDIADEIESLGIWGVTFDFDDGDEVYFYIQRLR